MFAVNEKPEGLVFKVFVQPGSSKNMIAGLYGDALKIRITAPPVEGAANKMCLKFLAKCLKVPKKALEIVSGPGSRRKQVMLHYQGDDVNESQRKQFKKKVEALLPRA